MSTKLEEDPEFALRANSRLSTALELLMKPAAIGCVAGIALSGLVSFVNFLNYATLKQTIENIEATRPEPGDKIPQAIAHVVPDDERGKAAVSIVRSQVEETRSFHEAWLSMARAFHQSRQTQGIIALGFCLTFVGILVFMRSDEKKGKEL